MLLFFDAFNKENTLSPCAVLARPLRLRAAWRCWAHSLPGLRCTFAAEMVRSMPSGSPMRPEAERKFLSQCYLDAAFASAIHSYSCKTCRTGAGSSFRFEPAQGGKSHCTLFSSMLLKQFFSCWLLSAAAPPFVQATCCRFCRPSRYQALVDSFGKTPTTESEAIFCSPIRRTSL